MSKGASLVGIVALITAIVALLISIGAYNRTGANLQNQAMDTYQSAGEDIENTIEETQESAEDTAFEVDMELQEATALVNLRQIKSDIEEQSITDETYEDITSVRENINDAYDDTELEMENEASTWMTDLDQLEQMLRANNTQEALSLVNTLIEKLENR